MSRPKMIVIGLDCAAPSLVFDRYQDAMPNLGALMERGTWGPLRSSEPPITVPAWTCMLSGRDPGELGLYGFRNRVEGETRLCLADGKDVRVKRVWDWLGEHGYRVAPLFVPLTYPPAPVRGRMVSGFMWPGGEAPWCFPRGLEAELVERFGPYQADVEGFRASDLDRIYRDIVAMTEQHLSIAEHIWDEEKPDFMMMVEIGLDRFHHAFWRHIDPAHPGYDPASPWKDLGLEYYGRLDQNIGRLLARTDEGTSVLVVSDHGARAMHGGFCINEWLRRNGYLSLMDVPNEPSALDHARVDWSRTRAWAEGGYYARVFLNVEGREPKGIVAPERIRSLRTQLREELENVTDDEGNAIAVSVRVPEEDYREARGFPPDLMVYFDDLRLRAIGSVGTGRIRVAENDTGPDGCNHDWSGIFVMSGGGTLARGYVDGAEIYDIAPTILGAFGIPRPPELFGRDWTK
ncbi:MAG TPA: alkaline phosphatase family protein [Polyangiales bacterium]|nr:alkaline phosphatase family protein [Polyangiales bacterium]